MGKAGRIACITIPWAATVASFICLILIEIAGMNKGMLSEYYFMKVNFTDIDVSAASGSADSTTLTAALKLVQSTDGLSDIYEIHLWNYCTSDSPDGDIDYCSKREAEFTFDLVDVWHLNGSPSDAGTPTSSADNAIESIADSIKGNTEEFESEVLGDAGKKAYDTYKRVAKAMFVLYAISFWTTLATIVLAVVAIFSRWGSFCTWIISFFSSVITLAAVAVSTALYATLTVSLRELFDPYNVKVQLGEHALVVGWLAVVFSWFGTLFWLFSICCCSGRSNPHHRSNKGGLWNAEPKGMGYGNYAQGRGMRVEKTGGGYERVADEHGDRVPLHDYPQPTGYARRSNAYEPFRNN